MKFVAILLLAIIAAADNNGCIAYVCDPSGATWADGVCAMRDTNTSQYDLKTGKCSSDEFCPAVLLSLSPSPVSCVTPDAPAPGLAAYPGENCDRLRECIGGTCTDGICSSLTTGCTHVYDCGLGKTCSAGNCVALAAVGSACTLDTDCINSAGCDGASTCVTYNSVAAGATVKTCPGGSTTILAPHALCSSGYCFEVTAGTYQCSGALASTGTPPMRITTAPFTCTSTPDTTSKLTLTAATGCGYDGYAYCPLFPADTVYASFANDVTSFIGSSSLANCNTARHGMGIQGNAFSVTYYFWCAQNLTDSQTVDMYNALYYPELANAESCQIKILNPGYYKVEGAESLIFGGLFLALLQ